jgi:predicted HTH domain antitoxin
LGVEAAVEARVREGEEMAKPDVELAVDLYRRGLISFGKARLLAGMDRWQFEKLLGERQVIRHYTEANLEEDVQYARGQDL